MTIVALNVIVEQLSGTMIQSSYQGEDIAKIVQRSTTMKIRKRLSLRKRELEVLCKTKTKDLENKVVEDYGFEEVFPGLYFQDNGAKVLAVAHLDVCATIEDLRFFSEINLNGESVLISPYLDDRLGVHICLNLLKQMSINIDILLTTGEESGCSTADFAHESIMKEYNWIVGFDRKGSDVVLYHYDTTEGFSEALEGIGFKIGMGTFSDISMMEDFGVGAFNMGIGYHNEHTKMCYCEVKELLNQLNLFKKFYDKFKDVDFPYYPEVHYPFEDWSMNEVDLYPYFKDKKLSSGKSKKNKWFHG